MWVLQLRLVPLRFKADSGASPARRSQQSHPNVAGVQVVAPEAARAVSQFGDAATVAFGG
jgi:hypothetical protein